MTHKSLESLSNWIDSVYHEFMFKKGVHTKGEPKDFKDFLIDKLSTLLPAKDFLEKYHPNIAYATLHYWMEKDSIDYIKVGNNKERFVILTEKTLNHKAAKHVSRAEKERNASANKIYTLFDKK